MLLGLLFSWIFAITSGFIWLFVFIPQLLENYKNKSSKALSFFLILFWLIGDSLSLLSAEKLNLNVLIVSGYYQIVFDIILLLQWFYYKIVEDILDEEFTQLVSISNRHCINSYKLLHEIIILPESISMMISSIILVVLKIIMYYTDNIYFISSLAWISSIMFLCARLHQIYLNYKRKSVAGLSYYTFTFIVLANICFVISLFVRLIDYNTKNEIVEYIYMNIQWILGTMSSIVLNFILLYQFYVYRHNEYEHQFEEIE
jgi:uncharacterized protein with PQ loop repeat